MVMGGDGVSCYLWPMRVPGQGVRIVPVGCRPAEVVAEAEVAGKSGKASSASGSRGDVAPVVVGSAGLAVVSGCSEFFTSNSVLVCRSSVSEVIPYPPLRLQKTHKKSSFRSLVCREILKIY